MPDTSMSPGSHSKPDTSVTPPSDYVTKDLFDANTILKADTDDTPVALTVDANRLIGRLTGGIAQIGLGAYRVLVQQATNLATVLIAPNNVLGRAGGDITDIPLGTNNLLGRQGGNINAIGMGAQTLLARTSGNITSLLVDTSRIVGRTAGGDLNDLTATEVRTVINVEDDADVTDAANVDAAGAVMEADFDAFTILVANSDNTPEPLFVDTYSIIGAQAGDFVNISLATNSVFGRTSSQLQGISLAVNSLLGRQSGNIDDIAVTAQRVVLNDGTGLKALEVSQGNVLGRGVSGVLRSLTATEQLDNIIQDAALCKPHIAGRYYASHSPHGEMNTTTDANDGPAGRILGRYFFAMGDTIDTISVNCSVEDVGKNMRFLIYDVGSDGLPDVLLYESGDISLTGTGVKTASSVAQHLTPGWYFIGQHSDSVSTAVFETANVAFGLVTIGLSAPTGTNKAIYKSATLGSPPDPFGAPTGYTGNYPFHDVFTYV